MTVKPARKPLFNKRIAVMRATRDDRNPLGVSFSVPDGLGAFSEMNLRLPHAIRGFEASLLDGAPNNRAATVDGDDIVYTIKFSDMRETQPGLWEWKY